MFAAGFINRSSVFREGLSVIALYTIGTGLVVGCTTRIPLEATPAAPQHAVFFDDFQTGSTPKWDALEGQWELREGDSGLEYGAEPRRYALTLAGPTSWKDYQIQATVRIQDDRYGAVGVVAHAERSHHYFEFVIGKNKDGIKSWFIRQRKNHSWNVLAVGAFDYQYDIPYVLRFYLRDTEMSASVSYDGGASFTLLGAAAARPDAWKHGRIGLVSYGAAAWFDDVSVVPGPELIQSHLGPWGHISAIRDDTATFSGRPAGGWYVTPIHVTLRPKDGKVLVTGFGRKGQLNCTGATQREVGETWLLDPAQLDALEGNTLFVTPINEQNLDTTHHVLYCAGHAPMTDGRIFFPGGTDYTAPGGLPDSSPELGLKYSRLYDPGSTGAGSFARISANMTGGHSLARGMKWYPTTVRLPDGRMLIYGGFHYSGGGPEGVPKPNLSMELFDPKIWDANPGANPYSILTQHENGDADTPPTRGYTNLFVLPKPVNAASAGTFARSVAVSGGVGRVVLFNHEPGPPTAAARLHRRTNSLSINPSTNEKGEGAPGAMLADGTLMYPNGGHSAAGTKRVYFYNPYTDSWGTPLETGISRLYGDAVQLPDGTFLLINGYNQNEQGNENDIPGGTGDVRVPQIIDPYASPRTVTSLPAWPEQEWRGYHSVALLLKDGRVLVGGGKDATHDTGCEKNEMRIYSPPYLSAGPRPTIETPIEGTVLTVGGSPLTIFYGGTARPNRGVVLVAPGSLTHSFDANQRYVPLTAVSGPGGGSVTVLPPANVNVAPPGDYLLFVISEQGVPSNGLWVKVAAPAPRVYAVGGDTYLEAECSSARSGPWNLIDDASRSAGQYIEVAQSSGNHTATTSVDEGKVMWYDLNVTSGGTYNMWFLSQGLTTSDDSLWVSVDGRADTQLTPLAAWGWRQAVLTGQSLATGLHQLKIKVREDGTRIDKIFLSKGTSAPTGLGGPAQISCGAPCTPPADPSNLMVTPGVCQATLMWADNSSNETGFRVQRNGVTVGTTGPGQSSFVDPVPSAGSYSYRVQAFNGGCDSGFSSTVTVMVTCGTGSSIANLVVNDTSTGNDGIPNNTQWSVQAGFDGGAGQRPFGDRTYTLAALPAAATHLRGKPWIRTAADSKTYAGSMPPVASATVNGSFVYLAVDDRHATGFLAGYTDQGYNLTVNEGTTARAYSVWRKPVTSGSTVNFPSIGSTTAPFYFVIVE
jgi:hypothetical protein